MKAEVGDWLVMKGCIGDQPDQRGLVTEVHSYDGSPPYVVHWLDSGHVATVFPGPDAIIVTAAEPERGGRAHETADRVGPGRNHASLRARLMVTNAAIIVGVDGSPSASAAVCWAARAAAMRNCALTLVYAAAPTMGAWMAAPVAAAVLDWQHELGREIVDAAVQIAKKSTNGSLRITGELMSESTVSALVQMSREAQMVVVGCRGRGALPRSLLGSVSMGLVHRADCPAAVIHDEIRLTKDLNRAPVLLGFDGSTASEYATEFAFDEASRRRVELVVLHAWWGGSGAFELPLDWHAVRPEVEETLAKQLERWQERYPHVPVQRLVVRDQPAHELVARSDAAQLIVVGSHGHGGIASTLLGSVSTAVVQAAQIPVIVARS